MGPRQIELEHLSGYKPNSPVETIRGDATFQTACVWLGQVSPDSHAFAIGLNWHPDGVIFVRIVHGSD
jgi:hypothetical protein